MPTQEELDKVVETLLEQAKKAGLSINSLTQNLEGASGSFTQVLNQGTVSLQQTITSIGSLASVVPVLGNTFQSLANVGADAASYFESGITAFEHLSKVGGGLSGNLIQLRTSVTDSRLGLAGFAELVISNSKDLVRFAGGVDGGTKAIGTIGQALRDTGIDARFRELGYSTEELTGFTVKYLAQNQRSMRLQGLSTNQQIQQAAKYAKSLTIISKLTGKNAEDMQNEINQRKKSGATQASLQLAERQGAVGASKAYEGAQAALQQAAPVVQNLLDDLIQTGVPMSEATKNFASLNSETYGLLEEAAAATKRGDIALAKELSEKAAAEAAAFAQSEEGLRLAALAQVSDVAKTQADAFEEIGPIIDRVKGNIEGLEGITGDTATFLKAWNDTLKAATDQTAAQFDGMAEGGEIRRTIGAAQKAQTDVTVEAQRTVNQQAFGAEVDYEQDMLAFQADVQEGAASDFTQELIAKVDELTGNILQLNDDKALLEEIKKLSKTERADLGITDDQLKLYEQYANTEIGSEKAKLRRELGAGFFSSEEGGGGAGRAKAEIKARLEKEKNEEIAQAYADKLGEIENLSPEDLKALEYGIQSLSDSTVDILQNLLGDNESLLQQFINKEDKSKNEDLKTDPNVPQIKDASATQINADFKTDPKVPQIEDASATQINGPKTNDLEKVNEAEEDLKVPQIEDAGVTQINGPKTNDLENINEAEEENVAQENVGNKAEEIYKTLTTAIQEMTMSHNKMHENQMQLVHHLTNSSSSSKPKENDNNRIEPTDNTPTLILTELKAQTTMIGDLANSQNNQNAVSDYGRLISAVRELIEVNKESNEIFRAKQKKNNPDAQLV
jgi:hypothetical protein